MIDSKYISKLAEILDKNNLTELECEDEGCRICLTRDLNGGVTQVYAQAPQNIGSMMQTQPMVAATPAAPEVPVNEDYSKNPGTVKSPMVGVVYLASDPNTPDYVKVGSQVAAGDTVCLIEAMKTFNPVKAHKGGKVTKILVEGGDPVEYGEPLIVIE